MDFSTDPEVQLIRETARRFVADELLPLEPLVLQREASPDPEQPILPPNVEAHLDAVSRKAGLWGIDVPERFGGLNLGNFVKYVVLEEIYYAIVPYTPPPDSPNLHFLAACCRGDQIERYLLPYARGETKSCLALTEPAAGSDVSGIKTRAVRRDGKWVLNGQKLWISNARSADFMIAIAVTDRAAGTRGGMTAFLVDRDTPGVAVSGNLPVISNRFRTYGVSFDDVELGDGQVLGEVGGAFAPLQNRLGVRRLEVAAWCLGYARRCIDLMIAQANARSTFGAPLADRQSVQWWIADSYQEMELVRLAAFRLAWQLDQDGADEKRAEIRRGAAMVKVQASEMATRVIDRAIQLFGGMGVSKEVPLEFMYRIVRILRIVEGASEVHRWTIARDLLRNGQPEFR